MKRVIILTAAILLTMGATAQTVENIRVDQDGDNILVHYRIGGSTDDQTYTVNLSCSIDGGRRFEPMTVFGDVNENIRGGKSNYTITWDVFEDLEEVGEVEFFVKVDLVSDLSPDSEAAQVQPQVQPQYQPQSSMIQPVDEFAHGRFFAYSGSTLSPLGISFGSLRKWGFYVSFRYGSYVDSYENDIWLTFMGGLNRHVWSKGKYRLHAFVGIGGTYEVYEEYVYGTSWEGTSLSYEFGFSNVIGRLNLSLGLEVVTEFATSPVFGVGFLF
jgi:hypothetical protein